MADILTGIEVAKSITENQILRVEECKKVGKVPTLAVVRVGAREDDLSYERGLKKRFEGAGCDVRVYELDENISQEELDSKVISIDEDPTIDGILMFRPLPNGLSDKNISERISSIKDSDSMGISNIARLLMGDDKGFAPCTARACMELLKYYGIELKGKKVTVVGRSLVIGKPVALMLLKENATVTVCHTRTADLKEECRNADIIVACAGVAKMINRDYVSDGQVVIDVGMNVDSDGKLCGDVDYDDVIDIVGAITPVPRGVGSVTTSVLLKHVVDSACSRINEK